MASTPTITPVQAIRDPLENLHISTEVSTAPIPEELRTIDLPSVIAVTDQASFDEAQHRREIIRDFTDRVDELLIDGQLANIKESMDVLRKQRNAVKRQRKDVIGFALEIDTALAHNASTWATGQVVKQQRIEHKHREMLQAAEHEVKKEMIAEAIEAGDTDAAVNIAQSPSDLPPEREFKIPGTTRTPGYEVVNEAKILREFLMPDHNMIMRMVKRHGADVEGIVGGIRYTITATSRRSPRR